MAPRCLLNFQSAPQNWGLTVWSVPFFVYNILMPRKKKTEPQPIWWVDSHDIRYAGTAAQAIELSETEMIRTLPISDEIRQELEDEFASDMRWVSRSRELAESHLNGRGFPLFLYQGDMGDARTIVEDTKTGWTLVLLKGGGPKGRLIDYSRDYPRPMMTIHCQQLVADIETAQTVV